MSSSLALITGGNRGLGRATALALAADGSDVVLTYRSHVREAETVADEVRAAGRKAAVLRLDTGDADSFAAFEKDLAGVLEQHWDRTTIDHLVNNAGHAVITPLGETSREEVKGLVDVQFTGVYFLTQQLVPRIADGGAIVNLSSLLARVADGPWSAYAALKSAVETLTRYWAIELGPRGIRVNTVAPGPIATDFAGGFLRDNDDAREQVGQGAVLGRLGTPEEIGSVVTAVLSGRFGWVTGQRIEVSGGFRP
ncbi:SDR family NAD(P)-dependent oxidoreductase [Amycolatopsis pigmentata]|uniref:SDR family NAD(P)-dependent oxidoreductase n=1 Tax=Amycolatopsis pigmentata TaxID=450801 RepID=A0ABW5G367_9PSEU